MVMSDPLWTRPRRAKGSLLPRLTGVAVVVLIAGGGAALVYSHTHNAGHRAEAEKLANEAVASYIEAATFMHQTLDPILIEVKGAPMTEMEFPARVLKDLPGLIDAEREERKRLAEIFKWPA